ncbi:MAG: RNA polymerase sigma factor [Actinomycetota bacterium]
MDVPTTVIERCRKGERKAFEELVRLTHREVYGLAMRLTGNRDDAAEVSQETYIRLLRSIRSFRGEAKFSTWLYRVTSSVAITRLRTRARRLEEPLEPEGIRDWPAPPSADPANALDRKLQRERLDRALLTLPVGYRTVIVAKDIYGLPLAEIGSQLGISEGAAKVRLFRARRRLKEMLYEEGGEDSKQRSKGIRELSPLSHDTESHSPGVANLASRTEGEG